MRGKVLRFAQKAYVSGITPAYAGKSRFCFFWFSLGEGSPPPMRGKVLLLLPVCFLGRDHPRLCGEKGHQVRKRLRCGGSPPPMRGKV